MTGREIMRRAVTFEGPERVGMTFYGWRLNDCTGGGPTGDPAFQRRKWHEGEQQFWDDEWGCIWSRLDSLSKGEVWEGPIKTWDDVDKYEFPRFGPERYEGTRKHFAEDTEHFRLGGLPGFPFSIMRKLRKMDNFLTDVVAEPERVIELQERVLGLLEGIIDELMDAGADGITFAEDWGCQDRLLINPTSWRKIFRPGFERLCGRVHDRGGLVLMHSCGYLDEIIDDLIGVGVNCLQFDQQENYGIDHLAEQYGGRMCFWCPVDIQKVLPTGDKEKIQAHARKLVERLGRYNGGFIGKSYCGPESLQTINVAEEWSDWSYEAFLDACGWTGPRRVD